LKITVGRIEHRTTGYNPYTADLLRETLIFEFSGSATPLKAVRQK
jgi:hypothetical protein